MNDIERERQIKLYREKMIKAWNEGRRAEARLMCRVHVGLVRGRSPEMVEKMERDRGVA